jgi:hypothetical protein
LGAKTEDPINSFQLALFTLSIYWKMYLFHAIILFVPFDNNFHQRTQAGGTSSANLISKLISSPRCSRAHSHDKHNGSSSQLVSASLMYLGRARRGGPIEINVATEVGLSVELTRGPIDSGSSSALTPRFIFSASYPIRVCVPYHVYACVCIKHSPSYLK